jgi:LysB family phage lysis regulatory protein
VKDIAVRVLMALAAVLAVLAAFWYVQSLRADLETAKQAEQTARQGNTDRDATIRELRLYERKNAEARARLEADQTGIRSNLATRELLIRDLQNENKELRDWSAVRLPGVVIGLRDHPAITGAAAYRERMRGGDALHTSGGGGEP